jgi:hypothetical protein
MRNDNPRSDKKMCSTWEEERNNIVCKLREFERENAVFIRMGNEIEEKRLLRAFCRNITCIGGTMSGKQCRGGRKG